MDIASDIINGKPVGSGETNALANVPTLLSISKSTRAITALFVAEIGLNVGQDQLLHVMDIQTRVSVSQMSVALNVRPSTVSKMVDRLADKGLVERRESDADARRTMLRLTPAGETKRSEVLSAWERLDDGLARADPNLDDDEVRKALISVDVALKKMLARLR